MLKRFPVEQVNHFLWRRQGFAWDREELSRPVLDSLIGVYATAPTCYLCALARDADFRFADLDDWLYTQRQAVRIRAMRYSNFIIPVRLLPVWDAYLMAYKDRRRFVPEAWYDYGYAQSGDATSTVLLKGAVGGIWDFQEKKKSLVLKVALFEEAGPPVWDALRQQAIRLAEVTGRLSAELARCEPVRLKGAAQNGFKSPLKEAQGETIFAA